MGQLGSTQVDLLLVLDLVLIGLVLVNLGRPYDEGLVMSQDILLDRKLDHLRGLADRTSANLLRAADF